MHFKDLWRMSECQLQSGRCRLPLLIPLLAVADCHAGSQSHEGHRREQQYQHAAADGVLTFFGCALGGAVAHGATLAEGGRCPERQKYRKGGQAQLHFITPRCRIRNASGKKTSIMARQNTSELMVTHFMGETSNFRKAARRRPFLHKCK